MLTLTYFNVPFGNRIELNNYSEHCLQSILPCAKLFSSNNMCEHIIKLINENVENESFDGNITVYKKTLNVIEISFMENIHPGNIASLNNNSCNGNLTLGRFECIFFLLLTYMPCNHESVHTNHDDMSFNKCFIDFCYDF